MIEITRKEE